MNIEVEYGDQLYRFLFPASLSPIFRKAGIILSGIGVALFIGLYFLMVRPVLRPGVGWFERFLFIVPWVVVSGVFWLGGWWIGHGRAVVTWDARRRTLGFTQRMGPLTSRRKRIPADRIERIEVKAIRTHDALGDTISEPGKLVVSFEGNDNREEFLVGYPVGVLQEFASQIRSYIGLRDEASWGLPTETDARLRTETDLRRLSELTRGTSGFLVRHADDGFTIHIKPVGLRGIGWVFLIGPIVGTALAIILGVMMFKVHAAGWVWLISVGLWTLVGGFSALAIHQLTKFLTIRFRDQVLFIEIGSRLKRQVIRIEAGEIDRVERYPAMVVNGRPVYGIRLTVSGRKRRIKLFHLQFYRHDSVVFQIYRFLESMTLSR